MAKKKKKKTKQTESEGASVTRVVAGIMIVIAVMGWGVMAASYEGAHTIVSLDDAPRATRVSRLSAIAMLIRALVQFAITAIQQLPNFFSVIGWHFGNRIWIPIAIFGLEGCALLFGFGLKSMEGRFDDPYAIHRAKRKAERESAQGGRPQQKRKKKRRSGL